MWRTKCYNLSKIQSDSLYVPKHDATQCENTGQVYYIGISND